MTDLKDLGWDAAFEEAFRSLNEPGRIPGRVVEELKGAYRVDTALGELAAEVSGRLRHKARGREDFPAVGDWAVLTPRPAEGKSTVHGLLPRRSKLSRKAAGDRTDEQVLAANIDTVFVVSSLNQDLNPRRIERALAMVRESGASPVLLLNKADLCEDPVRAAAQVEPSAAGAPVLVASALTGRGLEELRPWLGPGKTACLLGSSGVGKSSLINRLLGTEAQEVREIREDDDRGRHTTTRRTLFRLPGGGMIIDTPGMREIQVWEAEEALPQTFADIDSLAPSCRFRDCRHAQETGCAVRQAVADGTLAEDRYNNYLKLQREQAALARLKDERAEAKHKKEEKRLSSRMKKFYKP